VKYLRFFLQYIGVIRMKKCPKCTGDIPYKKILLLQGFQTLRCNQCNARLSTNKFKMLPFAIIVVILGFLFGMTYASTGMSAKWLKIIISYFVLVFFLSPFIIQLKIDKNK